MIASILIVTVACAQTTPSIDPAHREMLSTFLGQAREDRGIAAASAAIVSKDSMLWSAGAGVVETDANMTPDENSVFRIASITKLYTGTAILALRDDGKLALDDRIIKFVPEFRSIVGGEDITIRHILNHRSGLPRDPPGFDPYPVDGFTEAHMLGALTSATLQSVPGEKYSYSNFGVGLMGPLIARVSGMSYRAFVQKRVLDPIHSGCVWSRDDVKATRMVTSYQDRTDALVPIEQRKRGAMEPGGGLYCSARDMGLFLSWMLRGDAGVDDGMGLKVSSRKEMLDAPISWASGVNPASGRLASHSGAVDNYHSQVWLWRDLGIGIVALDSNGSDDDVDKITYGLRRIAFEGSSPDALREAATGAAVDDIGAHFHALVLEALDGKALGEHVVLDGKSDADLATMVAQLARERKEHAACRLQPAHEIGRTGVVVVQVDCPGESGLLRAIDVEATAPHRLKSWEMVQLPKPAMRAPAGGK